MLTKICSVCKEEKGLDDFYTRHSKCKDCAKVSALQNYYIKKNDPIWLQKRRESMRNCYHRSSKQQYLYTEEQKKSLRKWRENNKEKVAAHNAVGKAIIKGLIPGAKDLKCAWKDCPKQAAEYHHYLGYEKEHRLDVIPLCRDHHGITKRQPLTIDGIELIFASGADLWPEGEYAIEEARL